jgi:hypothetical protein
MLSPEDKQRIEEEELYRAQVRKKLGPVPTTSFLNKLAKFIVWWIALSFIVGLSGAIYILLTDPK